MLTKFSLTINGIEHETAPGDIKNWADVECAYKRADYGGVVRSFTSKFEFVGKAYDLLLDEYLHNRYMANVVLNVYVQNNRLEYDKYFECPLDFTTTSVENGVFKISSVDNSLAALIKANKSTKYELLIGEDIKPNANFMFDRLSMIESVTYALTQGTSDPRTGALTVNYAPNDDIHHMIFCGSVADEVGVGGTVYWQDDQGETFSSFCISALKSTRIDVIGKIDCDKRVSSGQLNGIHIRQYRGDSVIKTVNAGSLGGPGYTFAGEFSDLTELNAQQPPTSEQIRQCYALIGGIAWIVDYNGRGPAWTCTNQQPDEFFHEESGGQGYFDVIAGDAIRIECDGAAFRAKVWQSRFIFNWTATGDMCNIEAFTPLQVIDALFRRIAAGHTNVVPIISNHDPRLANTLILAAESIRDIPNAKFYSSLNEFCEWLNVVFGYTYYIGRRYQGIYNGVIEGVTGLSNTPYTNFEGICETVDGIYYVIPRGMFLAHGQDENGISGFYRYWPSWERICHPGTQRPYSDKLYKIGDDYYYFTEEGEARRYIGSVDYLDKEYQEVVFVHRSELFDGDVNLKEISDAIEVSQSVVSSQIFATVEIGYDKQDYDSVNGRDEFNFYNTYQTGCTLTDKTLTMKSPYRADCYGIEFLAQKRGADSTDNKSDSKVFFVYCNKSGALYYADRDTYPISGALSGRVFNGAFSPMQCVRANEGYIGMQSDVLNLSFASSAGNSGIAIGGEPLSSDLVLQSDMLTTDEVSFTTRDLYLPEDINDRVAVTSGGLRYIGFIKEVDIKTARTDALKYKLFVKSIERC